MAEPEKMEVDSLKKVESVGEKREREGEPQCPLGHGAHKKQKVQAVSAPKVQGRTDTVCREAYQAIFSEMQPGLVYPADHALFSLCWVTDTFTKALLKTTVEKVNEFIEKKYFAEGEITHHTTSMVVGVSFPLFEKWCKEEGKSIPKAMKTDNKHNVFTRAGSIFKDSGAAIFFHIKAAVKAHVESIHKVLKESIGEDLKKEVSQACNRRDRLGEKGKGRVLGCRFAENLNNPADPITVANHTLVGYEDPDHLGGSVLLAQQLDINWEQLHLLNETQIEDLVGRTSDDLILPSRDPRCHIRASRHRDDNGKSSYVMRLGLPYEQDAGFTNHDLASQGANRGDEKGIFFAGFAKSVSVLESIMNKQIGDDSGYMNDRLLNHMRAEAGGFFYIPSVSDLGCKPSWAVKEWEKRPATDENWAKCPGMDWSKLSRHFEERSKNNLMFYSHTNYLYSMILDSEKFKKAGYTPPSARILILISDMFRVWQDTWYFEKNQPELGHLEDLIAQDYDETLAKKIMDSSIMIRKGWATRMTCRKYTSPEYGYRGMKNGVCGTDTYRIHPVDIFAGSLPELSLGQGLVVVKYIKEGDEKQDAFMKSLSEASGVGHVCPNFEKLLNKGLGGLLEEARTLKDKANVEAGKEGNDASKGHADFYEAVIQSLRGVQDSLMRYADLAGKMMAKDEYKAFEQPLQALQARCRKLGGGAVPSSMKEALQLVFSYHCMLHLTGEPTSIGRLDQYIGKFYDDDIKEGRLTKESAQEAIDAFWVKMSEKMLINRSYMQDRQPFGYMAMGGAAGMPSYPQGASLNQWIMQVTVGGVVANDDEKATAAYNEVTKMMIRASGRLPLTSPCLSLRVHKETPDDVLNEAARAILSGGAHPILMNDDKIIPGLQECGNNIGPSEDVNEDIKKKWDSTVALKDARNYSSDGCYEPVLTGECSMCLGGFTALEPLECALNEGRTYGSAGECYLKGPRISDDSTPANEIASFEQLLRIYFDHFKLLWTKRIDGQLSSFGNGAEFCPAPLLSVLTGGCMEKGMDIHGGGAHYNIYAPGWIAVPTVIDSLYAIQEMVYGEKAMTSLPELVKCLMCDWGHQMVEPFYSKLLGPSRLEGMSKRFKMLRKIAMGLPKYGHGNPDVDTLGNRICKGICEITVGAFTEPYKTMAEKFKNYAKTFGTAENPFGIQITPGVGTFENFTAFGAFSGASADGRRKGGAISSDFSAAPTPGDQPPQKPKTRFVDSMKSFNSKEVDMFWDSAPNDFNIREDFPLPKLQEILRKFSDGEGGNLMTITCANPETMKEAVSRVEKYDLLRVRMGGWSEFFSSMFAESQQQHLRRPVSLP